MMKHAVVIVLGDTGRSPRMQFHASSLSELDEVERVTLIGYSGENCNDAITQNHSIRDMRINSNVFKSIEFLRKYSSILHAIVKGIVLVLSIISLLFQSTKSFIDENGKELKSIPISFVIIQNPPATPVILATVLYRVLLFIYSIVTFSDPTSKTFTICIDWHNLGFTLYYDRYKPTHILVRISYHLEHVMAQLSDMNLCVSAAMQKWLLTNYGIDSTVFYDRPPKSVFQKFDTNNDSQRDSVGSSGDVDDSDWNGESIGKDSDDSSCCCVPLSVRHELLRKLKLTDTALFPSLLHPLYTGQDTPCTDADSDIDHYPDTVMTEVTIQTYRHRRTGELHMRQDRAVVLLSSTSWTADEDFTLLTKALSNLDKSIAKRRGSESPRKKLNHAKRFSDQQVSDVCTRVVVVITGKGPMKEQFMSDWNESQREGSPTKLNLITLVTVWLEIGDYPLMVGCADMGICLHTSSSGVDLPMKVLDMFGSAVPVCAVAFPALPELVQNGANGIIFRTSSELSAHLFRLFCDYPHDFKSLRDLNRMKKKTLTIGCWEDNWGAVVRPMVIRSFATDGPIKYHSVLSWTLYVLGVAILCAFAFRVGATAFDVGAH